jgi:hypothetical protein
MRLPKTLNILILSSLLVSPAAAQSGEKDKPKPGEQDKSKASGEQDTSKGSDASLSFKEGQKLFDSADYLGAIDSFEKAYRLRPHFSVLCNIALCHERRSDMIEAARYYKRCRDESAGKSGQAVENSLKRVEARITWIKVTSSAGGMIYVDGKQHQPAPARIAVNPGSHVIEVRKEGAEPVSATVKTRGGEERELDLSPAVSKPKEKPRKRRKLHQAYFWSAAGLTFALAVAATITGIQTLGIRDDYEDSPSRDLLDRGRNRRLATNVLWGLAAVTAAGTTTLYFFTDLPWKKKRDRDAVEEVSIGVGVQGVF